MSVLERPKGTTRFQELSSSRQPLPSAELDDELNRIVNFVNAISGVSGIGANVLYSDAGLEPKTVDINGYTEIYVLKTDATSNLVTVYDSSGCNIMGQSEFILSQEGESIHLILKISNWYKI